MSESIFYILLSLFEPRHGYGIMRNIKEITGGRVSVGPGTLYGAVGGLLEKGWIEAAGEGEPRRKIYRITRAGKNAVRAELKRLDETLAAGYAVLGETRPNKPAGMAVELL